MLFYPFWFGIRFGSPNHWFCRTTEPHRTSGSAELTEPNRTFGLTLLHFKTCLNFGAKTINVEGIKKPSFLKLFFWTKYGNWEQCADRVLRDKKLLSILFLTRKLQFSPSHFTLFMIVHGPYSTFPLPFNSPKEFLLCKKLHLRRRTSFLELLFVS